MRGLLLLLGGTALCILVAATHEEENERPEGDFGNIRAIRSTGGNKVNTGKRLPGQYSFGFGIPSPRKTRSIEEESAPEQGNEEYLPAQFNPVVQPSLTRKKRNITESVPQNGKNKRCPGCYSPFSATEVFGNIRAIRSTGGNKVKTKPPRRPLSGVFSVALRPSKTRKKRSIEESAPEQENNKGDFGNIREIRSTEGNNKKPRPPRKYLTGQYSSSALRPPNTRKTRSIEESAPEQGKKNIAESAPRKKKNKKCPGCFSISFSMLQLPENAPVYIPVIREARDTEEHEKLEKKQKHFKERSHGKRRRHKHHKHVHIEGEDPETDHNNRRRKHHRGRKERWEPQIGSLSALGQTDENTQGEDPEIDHNNRRCKHHRGRKERGETQTGSLSGLAEGVGDTKEEDPEIDHNNRRCKHHRWWRKRPVSKLERQYPIGRSIQNKEETHMDIPDMQVVTKDVSITPFIDGDLHY